jgi:arginine exporter protein ArgO
MAGPAVAERAILARQPRARYLLAMVAVAQLCDLLTFVPAVGRVGIAAEQNPLARYLYEVLGAAGPAALKVMVVIALLTLLGRVLQRYPRYWAPPVALAVALGFVGAWSNIAFGLVR